MGGDTMAENEPGELEFKLRTAFPLLKRCCDPIALHPEDTSNAKRLRTFVSEIETSVLEKLSDYMFVPVFIHLSNRERLKSETVCSVLECLKVMLEYVPIRDEEKFWKLYLLIFPLVHSASDDEYASKLPEELKMLVVECLTLLFKNASVDVLRNIYTHTSHRRLSVVVFLSVQLARREKFIKLRVAALKLIQKILLLDDCYDKKNKKQAAEFAGLMMPGVVSCAVSVATSTETLNHKVVVEAIRLWARLISLVMEDNVLLSPTDSKTFRLDVPLTVAGFADSGKEYSVGSVEWLEQSQRHLVGANAKMLNLVQHNHWKVRISMAEEVGHIVSTAPNNMRLSMNHLLDGLLCLSQDENEDVNLAAKQSLENFARDCQSSSSRGKLIEIVEETFYSLLTRLPRTLHGFDLSQKEWQLSVLAGYIDVLGRRYLPGLLNSSQHLTRLLKCLYTAACLDCTTISLLEEQAVRDIEEGPGRPKVWMNLKHSSSPNYGATLEKIAQKLLMFSGDCGPTIVYTLCDNFQSEPIYRKEILYLLNLMFKTPSSNDEKFLETRCCLAIYILDSLLEQNLWHALLETSQPKDKIEAQSNIIELCLLADLVALLAAVVGPGSFAPYLLSCLYPLLECAGSPLYALSTAGLNAVRMLAHQFGSDVGRLVADNVDYLSYHVTINLRNAYKNPRVLSVLTVIMNHSTFAVFPSLYEIVKDVLVQSCDTFQDVNATAFLHVFLTFVSRLLVWENENISETARLGETKVASVWDDFIDFYKTTLAVNDSDAHTFDDINEGEIEDEYAHPMEGCDDEKPPVPQHITLTVDILHRSLHFLPSKETARQILVLQILQKGVLVLSRFTDQLLPIVHKIWSPLVRRFSADSNALILRRSFDLLQTLASTSKDFIRPRTCKEVIPFLCKHLKEQIREMNAEKEKKSQQMTQSYKLVHSLLNCLGDVAIDLDVGGDELEIIVTALTPYLSNNLYQQFQEAALKSIIQLSKIDAHIIWTHLMSINPNVTEFVSPSSGLLSFKVTPPNDCAEYGTNVSKILNDLDCK